MNVDYEIGNFRLRDSGIKIFFFIYLDSFWIGDS